MLSGPMNGRFRPSRPAHQRPWAAEAILPALFLSCAARREGKEKRTTRTAAAPQTEREAAARLHETGQSQPEPAAPCPTVRRRAATHVVRFFRPDNNNSIQTLLLKMSSAEVPLPVAVPSPEIPAANGGSCAVATAAAAAPATESKTKKKICCACPDTKRLRDECIVEHGESACTKWIEAHKSDASVLRGLMSESSSMLRFASIDS